MNPEEIEMHKKSIDRLIQFEMALLYRFAPVGHPYFTPELAHYFQQRFREKGGMTPELSRLIGTYEEQRVTEWDRQ